MRYLAIFGLFGLSEVLGGPCKPKPHHYTYVDGTVIATAITWYDPGHHPHPTHSGKHYSSTMSISSTSPPFHHGHPNSTVSTPSNKSTTICLPSAMKTTSSHSGWVSSVSHTSSASHSSSKSTMSLGPRFTTSTSSSTITTTTTSTKSTTSSSAVITTTISRAGTLATTTTVSGTIGTATCDNSLSSYKFYLQATDTRVSLQDQWGVLTQVDGLKKMKFVADKSTAGIWQFVLNVCNLASAGTVAERLVMNTPAGTTDVEPQFNLISQVFATGHAAPECNWEDKTNLVCGADFYVCANGLLGIGPVPAGCDKLTLKVVLST